MASAVGPMIVKNVLEGILRRPNVPVNNNDANEVADKVVDAIKESNTIAVVEQKSPVKSKILWTQIVGFGAMAAAFFGLNIDQETQLAIVAGIGAVTQVTTFIMKTWFTKSVATTSMPSK